MTLTVCFICTELPCNRKGEHTGTWFLPHLLVSLLSLDYCVSFSTLFSVNWNVMFSISVHSTRCKWTAHCKHWTRSHLHSLSNMCSQLMQPESTLSHQPWQKSTDECCPCISHMMLQPLLQYNFIWKLHATYHHTQTDMLHSAVPICVTDYTVILEQLLNLLHLRF